MLKQLFQTYKLKIFIIVYALIAIWGMIYFTKEVPMFEGKVYKDVSPTEDYKHYRRYSDSEIFVYTVEDAKVVKIGSHEFTVYDTTHNNTPNKYTVIYPGDKTYIVEEQSGGSYYAFNEDGSFYFGIVAGYSNPALNVKNASDFHPVSIVEVAIDRHYEKRGVWYEFYLALIGFILCHVLWKNYHVQMFLFQLEHRFDVVDPEPSDFYFTTTKIGAVVGMFICFIFMMMSL